MQPAERTLAVAIAVGAIMAVVAAYMLIDAAETFLPGLDMSDIAAVTVAVLLSLTACILRLMCAGCAGSRRAGMRTERTLPPERGSPLRDRPA